MIGKAEKQSNTMRHRQAEKAAICCYILQMPAPAGAGLGWSHKPGTPSGTPMWVAGTQFLEPVTAAFWVCMRGSWNWEQNSLLTQSPPMGHGYTNARSSLPAPSVVHFRDFTMSLCKTWRNALCFMEVS